MKRVRLGLNKCVALMVGMVAVTGFMHADDSVLDTRTLGVEIGAAKVQGDTLLESDHVSTGVEFGIRVGVQSDEWRTLLSGSFYNNVDSDQQYVKAVAQLDYFVVQDEPWKPYIGLNVGYISYTTTTMDTGSFMYGGEVGLQYRIDDNMAIDAAYRYSFIKDATIDHVEAFVLGIDYLY